VSLLNRHSPNAALLASVKTPKQPAQRRGPAATTKLSYRKLEEAGCVRWLCVMRACCGGAANLNHATPMRAGPASLSISPHEVFGVKLVGGPHVLKVPQDQDWSGGVGDGGGREVGGGGGIEQCSGGRHAVLHAQTRDRGPTVLAALAGRRGERGRRPALPGRDWGRWRWRVHLSGVWPAGSSRTSLAAAADVWRGRTQSSPPVRRAQSSGAHPLAAATPVRPSQQGQAHGCQESAIVIPNRYLLPQ
jgi:hypothetical protein